MSVVPGQPFVPTIGAVDPEMARDRDRWLRELPTFATHKELKEAIQHCFDPDRPIIEADIPLEGPETMFPIFPSAGHVHLAMANRLGVPNATQIQVEQARVGMMQRVSGGWAGLLDRANRGGSLAIKGEVNATTKGT